MSAPESSILDKASEIQLKSADSIEGAISGKVFIPSFYQIAGIKAIFHFID
jgi:hypothetical protein